MSNSMDLCGSSNAFAVTLFWCSRKRAFQAIRQKKIIKNFGISTVAIKWP